MITAEKQASGKASVPDQKPESIVVGRVVATEVPFTVWSAMAIGASTTNTAIGIILTLGTIVFYGGSVLLFWGFIVMTLVGLAVAISLSELVSAIPDAGGQYVWMAALSPPGPRRFLSYVTAIFSWAGAVCTSASVCVVGPTLLFTLGTLLNPDFQPNRWTGFAAYQGLNLITLALSLFEHLLPKFTKGILTFTILLMVAFFVGLLASGGPSLSAREVFVTNFTNGSGWPDGVGVFIGINGINWAYSCLDAIVHIAEEIPQPATNIPKALLLTILVGFVSGLPIVLAFCFKMTNYTTQYSAMATMYELFGQSTAAAIGYQIPLFISTVGAMWGIHVWQSRLAWTIGLNKGFPFSKHLSKIMGPPFHTPVWALVGSAGCTSLLGFLYVASTAAFNSLVSAGILFQYASYCIPVALLLLRGRSKFQHGPVWYPWLGFISNIVLLCWSVVSLVFYCLPYTLPVSAGDMNYISVVLVVVFLMAVSFWFTFAKKTFTDPELGSNSAIRPVF